VQVLQWWQTRSIGGHTFFSQPAWRRWIVYVALLLIITNLGVPQETPFIYFQF